MNTTKLSITKPNGVSLLLNFSVSSFNSCCGVKILHGLSCYDADYDYVRRLPISKDEETFVYGVMRDIAGSMTVSMGGTKVVFADKDRGDNAYEYNNSFNFHKFADYLGYDLGTTTANYNEGTRDWIQEYEFTDYDKAKTNEGGPWKLGDLEVKNVTYGGGW